MQKFGVLTAGLVVVTSATLAQSERSIQAKTKGHRQTLSSAELPATAEGMILSKGTIRLKDGLITSDKPMHVISRKAITVLPNGGIYMGQAMPNQPTGLPPGWKVTKISPVK